MIIISDTSVIINLARVGYLHLLPNLFGTVSIPKAVYDEIVIQGKGKFGADEIKNASWVSVEHCKNVDKLIALREILDKGETEAIALALENKGSQLLIDEAEGRKIAISHGIFVTGVLGILTKAKELGHITKVKPIMDKLLQGRFHIAKSLYQEVLERANEA